MRLNIWQHSRDAVLRRKGDHCDLHRLGLAVQEVVGDVVLPVADKNLRIRHAATKGASQLMSLSKVTASGAASCGFRSTAG
jgi:hypothetical protein